MCYARDSNLLLNNTASIYVYKGERHTDTSVWWGDPRVKIRNLWLKEGSQGKKVFRWLFFFLGEFSLFSGGLAPNGTTTTTTRNRSTVVWAWWGAIRPRNPPPPRCHTRRRERRGGGGGGGGMETSPPLNALCLLFSVFFLSQTVAAPKESVYCLFFESISPLAQK